MNGAHVQTRRIAGVPCQAGGRPPAAQASARRGMANLARRQPAWAWTICAAVQVLAVGGTAADASSGGLPGHSATPAPLAAEMALAELPLPAGTARTDLGDGLAVSGLALRIQVFDAPA